MTSPVGLWIDFSSTGWGGTAYDDVTPYLRSISYSRGGTPEITGSAGVGSCTIELRDPDGRFDPDNALGPLYGKLTDGLRVWFGANEDGTLTSDPLKTVRGRFAGRTLDWTPIPAAGATTEPTVQITCEDPKGWFGRLPVSLSVAGIATDYIPPIPAVPVSGLYLFHSERGTSDTWSAATEPSGWAMLQRSTQTDGAGGQMDVASGPSLGRSYTFLSGAGLGLATEGVMTEMSSIDPHGSPTTYSASESGGAGTTPAITCVVPGSGVLLAGIRISNFDSGTRALTAPAGTTTIYQRVNTGGPGERDWGVISVVYRNVTAGSYTLTWTMSNTYADWGKALVAIFIPTTGASTLVQAATSGESGGGYTVTLPSVP